jgi:transaldolase
LVAENPTATEDVIAWKLIEEMGIRGAEMLLPVFERERHLKGRLSMQTNPVNYMDFSQLVEQAVHFDGLAPNIQVKIPATATGIVAIEEATRRGVNINATVSFTLPQAIAVAEAVERGLDRRAKEGHDVSGMRPVCTLMIGRLDDWLKVVAKREGITITPGHLDWGGIAVFKKAYGIFKARGYRARLLAAAYRHHMHWSELIGGDVVLTIPYEWQVLFNKSDIEVKPRINDPVDPAVVDELYRKFSEFRRAYDEDGLSVPEFDHYGATVRTLRSFIEAYRELTAVVRDSMLPPP